MIIKFLLSLGLGFVFLFYMANSRRGISQFLISCLSMAAGLVFIWNPELANHFAGIMGVGRGADLIFYFWIIISMAIFVGTHLKLKQTNEAVTSLVRETAIAEARGARATKAVQGADQ